MSAALLAAARRRGDAAPAPWTPASVTPLFWVDAPLALAGSRLYLTSAKAANATAVSDPVGAWEQEGSITPDLLQATTGARGYVTTVTSGADAVGFDGIDDRLASAQTIATGAKTLAFRYQYATAPGAAEFDTPLNLGAATNQIRLLLAGASVGGFPRLSWSFDATASSAVFIGTNGWTADTTEHTVVIAYDGVSKTSTSSYRVWVDGVEQVTVARSSAASNGTTSLGANNGGGSPGAIKYVRVALLDGDQSAIIADILTWV